MLKVTTVKRRHVTERKSVQVRDGSQWYRKKGDRLRGPAGIASMNFNCEYTIDKQDEGIWIIRFANDAGEYELTGPWPVQAVGTIHSIYFVFHAARDQWEFETENEVGHPFPSNDGRAFQRIGKYGNASEMELSKAVLLIEICINELIAQISFHEL